MRQIAAKAGVSTGLAYHYFSSKEAVVLAYYDQIQRDHIALFEERVREIEHLEERIRTFLDARIDLLAKDRQFLVALSRVLIDPTSPISAFSKETSVVRGDALVMTRKVVDHPDVPDDLRDIAATAVWALMMGVLLFFLFDSTPNTSATRTLIVTASKRAATLLQLLGSPFFAGQRAELLADFALLGTALRPPAEAVIRPSGSRPSDRSPHPKASG